MPGVAGVTVVTTLVCFIFITREAAGALRARHSLRPLISKGRTCRAKLGRIAPRECGCSSLRGATRRSNPAFFAQKKAGLLRFARNDGNGCLKME
jgi:hypothetical protein